MHAHSVCCHSKKRHATELAWRRFLLGESEREKAGGERGDWALRTGVAEEKRKVEGEGEERDRNRETGREAEVERERKR